MKVRFFRPAALALLGKWHWQPAAQGALARKCGGLRMAQPASKPTCSLCAWGGGHSVFTLTPAAGGESEAWYQPSYVTGHHTRVAQAAYSSGRAGHLVSCPALEGKASHITPRPP